MAKSGTKTIAHLSIADGLSFLSIDRIIYDSNLRNEKNRYSKCANKLVSQLSIITQGGALIQYFKGLSEDGRAADFSKNLLRLSI